MEKGEGEDIPMSSVAVVGPTAVGKTALAIKIAHHFGGEIVGLDSMQIYRYLDIGTAKPTPEERAQVPHHLIDFIDPAAEYSVACYREDALRAGDELRSRSKLPILVGGTGLYLRALEEGLFTLPTLAGELREQLQAEIAVRGLDALYQELRGCDPETAARIHPHDSYRITRALEIFRATGVPWSTYLSRHRQRQEETAGGHLDSPFGTIVKIGLDCERTVLYERINRRVTMMVDGGLVAEVEDLLARGYSPELKPLQAIGYRHVVNYLLGRWSWEESFELLARDTRRYAKRQYTWFRRDPEIVWFHPEEPEAIIAWLESRLRRKTF